MGESTRFSRSLDDSKAVALTGKIMVVAIIVLFVVVVFVIFLHLYAKWFWRRLGQDEEEEEGTDSAPSRIRRRNRRSRFVFAPGQDPGRGLDSSVLRSLPALVFRAEDFRDGLECAVCLSELADGERARLLPKCNHGFHVDCIDMWFQSHSTCPLCRNSVAPEKDSSPELSGAGNSQIGADSAAAEESETDNIHSFPTNVLIWGDQSQVSSGNACLEGEGGSAANVLPSPSNDGVLVIDVPRENPAASSSASGEELKSPVTTRLRSLKRLLSREKRVNNPCSSNSVSDIEQGNRAQS